VRKLRTEVVVGLDLSLRAAAVCAIPIGWGQDLTKVVTAVFGASLTQDATTRDRLERLIQIAHDIELFCIHHKATHVATEAYAFAARSSSAHALAELGGVVKTRLLDHLDIVTESIVASQARKTLLQKLPRKKVKEYTLRNVRRLGGVTKTWTDDEIDAMVIANHLLMTCGGVAMTFEGE